MGLVLLRPVQRDEEVCRTQDFRSGEKNGDKRVQAGGRVVHGNHQDQGEDASAALRKGKLPYIVLTLELQRQLGAIF